MGERKGGEKGGRRVKTEKGEKGKERRPNGRIKEKSGRRVKEKGGERLENWRREKHPIRPSK